jgi:hypothetical protein
VEIEEEGVCRHCCRNEQIWRLFAKKKKFFSLIQKKIVNLSQITQP